MGLFDDVSRFLETRLEEFLQNHPHLEIQALEEQLREQERDTQRIIADLQLQQKNLQNEILSIAEDIQLWHSRVNKAKQANRPDLVQAAQAREASLLRSGNQRWGQMEGVKKRLVQSQELLHQIQQRRKEVEVKAAQVKANTAYAETPDWETTAWNQASSYRGYSRTADPLEQKFREWETEDELEQMKRNMGK